MPRPASRCGRYDPQVPGQSAVKACCDVVNRGVAVWKGKVYVGTIDGRLIALDAATGNRLLGRGHRRPDEALHHHRRAARREGQGDHRQRRRRARRARLRLRLRRRHRQAGLALLHRARRSGERPRGRSLDGVRRARPGHGEWWKIGGGGTVWDAHRLRPRARPALRRHRQRLALEPHDSAARAAATTCSSPRSSRCDADTGEYVWHYQTTPGETWDYTATQHDHPRRPRRSTGSRARC